MLISVVVRKGRKMVHQVRDVADVTKFLRDVVNACSSTFPEKGRVRVDVITTSETNAKFIKDHIMEKLA